MVRRTKNLASLLLIGFVSAAIAQDYERNDAWTTPDQAARRGLTDAANASQRDQWSRGGGGHEFGGWIYENQDGGYGYTSPKTSGNIGSIDGLHDGVIANLPTSADDPDYIPRLPTGERVVGVYHNHPSSPRHNSSIFSLADLEYSEVLNIPVYLITPNGTHHKYDPDLHDPDSFNFYSDNDPVEPVLGDDEARYAHAVGEPHLGTHDGNLFDFQAAGEFIAIESDDGELMVVLRLEPYAGLNFVSIVTGVSVTVGNDMVDINAVPPYLLVNGEAVDGDMELPGALSASTGDDAVTVQTAAGDRFIARRRYNEWLDVEFSIADTRKGHVHGLLGDYDGDPANDFQTRDGELIDLTSGSSRERRNNLYRVWGASWRVGGPGLASDYPSTDMTYADLPRDASFAAAKDRCAAVGAYQKTAVERCIFDIVVTGDDRFAETYRDEVGASYETVVAADAGVEIAGSISRPGEIARHRILVRNAGQQFFVVQERFDKPLDLIKVGLYDDDGQSIANKCFGCGNLGLFSVNAPGTYYFQAGGERETATGQFTLRYWYVSEPDQFQMGAGTLIAPGRPGDGAGEIERPGSADEYRFNAPAGTRLRVRIEHFDPDIDLVAWQILDEDGESIMEKCLGCGSEEVVDLQDAGEYVLRIGTTDRDRGTGSYSIALSPET